MISTLKDRNNSVKRSWWFLVLSAALSVSAAWAQQTERELYDDFTTQMLSASGAGNAGSNSFGDRTDTYSGATSFLVTDVNLPGNSDLPVSMQRSLNAADDGMGTPLGMLSGEFLTWSRYEVPYLSGIYKSGAGWQSSDGDGLAGATNLRCSHGGAPEVTQSSGKESTWEAFEYWHANQIYLPGGGTQVIRAIGPSDMNAPTDGATYRYVTKDHWYFSCLPSTANGVAGEGFLARAPDGKKYYFDWLVRWRSVSALWKTSFIGDPTVISRSEYRMLLRRVEDRFGNWVNYTYSGSDLTNITANDGRQLTLSYVTPGGALSSVTDGTRTWSYDYSNGLRVTFPDSTVWSASISSTIRRLKATSCNSPSMKYDGQATVTIQLRSGATGTFVFGPVRRGLSWVFYNSASWPCPPHPKEIDNVGLFSKAVSGAGFTSFGWSYSYGPPNGCHTYGTGACTAASPTTRYVDITGPSNTFARYTFGNRWHDDEGALLRIQTGSSASSILRDESIGWQTFAARGLGFSAAGDAYASEIVRREATRTISQDGATYVTTHSNWDSYFNPQSVAESGPNGGSRTTQLTYYNNLAKWVIGKLATSTSPGRSVSLTYNADASLQDATRNGVTTSYTYHPDGTVATITKPRSLLHEYSNYKRGIPQTEAQAEGIALSRTVNDAGFVMSMIDGEQHTRSFQRDPMGRVTAIDMAVGNDTTINYLGAAKSTKTSTRGSLTQTISYDALWRPTTISNAGIDVTFQYDAFGRKTFESNPGETRGTHFEYDALGRLTKVTNADDTYRSMQFGPGTTIARDERSKVTTRTYRSYGSPSDALLIGIAPPDASADVTIGRAPNGNISSITQGGYTRTYEYDSRNLPLSETHPETGATVFEVDDAGNVTASTHGSLRVEQTYDGQNRLSTTTYSDGTPAVTYTWTKTGQLHSVTTATTSRTLGYDDNDNLTTESLNVGGTLLAAVYAYNGNDQLSSITYPISQRVVSYAPDNLGRPTQVSGYVSSVTYWPSGLVRQIDYANGISTNYEQNARLWTSGFSTRRAGTYYANSSSIYDGAGNLTTVTDSVDAMNSRSLGYDDLNRLTSASGPWGSGTIGYDGVGNITAQNLGALSLSYGYDDDNRLSSVAGRRTATYSYDDRGNITAAAGTTYLYDGVPNLLCVNCGSAGKVEYAYDGKGSRVTVTKSGTTTYEFTASTGELLAEYTPSTSQLVEHIYLAGKRIAQRVTDQSPPTALTPVATQMTADQFNSVTIAVNVGGTSPQGSVKFVRQGATLGAAFVSSARASIDVTGLTHGAHSITATYSGDAANPSGALTYQIQVTVPAPAVPASITVPSGSTSGSYAITWGASNGLAAYYQLYEATNTSFSGEALVYSGSGTTTQLSGRGNGSYYYRVVACNSGGCSGHRTGANGTLVTLPPGTPASINVPANSYTVSFVVSWSTPSGQVTSYQLYQATNASFSGETLAYSGPNNSVELSGRATGSYYYRVRACYASACGGFAAGGPIGVTQPPSTPPWINVPTTNTTGTYTISWGASTGTVTSYLLDESTTPTFANYEQLHVSPATSITVSNRTNGTYYYRVRAANTSTVPAVWSPYLYSPPVTVNAPALLAAVNNDYWGWYQMRGQPVETSPPIVVTATGGAGGYTYQWERVSGDGSTQIASPTSASTIWTRGMLTATYGVSYVSYWRCRVTDAANATTYTQNVQVVFRKDDRE
ncbi:Ig-like domain repeat protein [Peristeroidobacter agariperforans]|uniref:Ig-like domain repeat protein n=1 Tax=Peristeroidobacter agariperforans TaxID=268404 RepID=UPI00101CD4AD|nr:Ig-like domain repeat protein [Peristeroidobacter agariperforans]